MQRKLINYEVFEKLQENSLALAQYELKEAEKVLATAIESGPLTFHNFTENHVLYETSKGTFIRANYKVDNGSSITLDNIEEIVIDKKTYNESRRENIRKMLDSILEDNNAKASTLLNNVMGMIRENHKREAAANFKHKITESTANHKTKNGKRTPAEMHTSWMKRKPKSKKFQSKPIKLSGRKQKHFQEWYNLSENIFGYINFVENNIAINNSLIKKDDKGSVVAVKIPTTQSRNEGKILNYGLKTMKTDVKVLRETARRLPGNREFCEMIAELKRHNNLSDNSSLEESLSQIITKFPSVLYLTHSELSDAISQSLSNLGSTNYDDNTCNFMSEGILRAAHEAYSDRVNRITALAGKEIPNNSEDPFASFAEVVEIFYPTLDEQTALEMRVFEDLYNATVEIRNAALSSNNESIREEATTFASELETILHGESIPSLELASEVATWLQNIVETNLETKAWQVVKTPHNTEQGDHPDMFDKAKQGYTPSSDFSGDWGDSLPQISGDKTGYKGDAANQTRNKSFANKGKDDVWPSLTNPYVKAAGDYTMKGEKGVDKDYENGLDMWQSADTWPNIQNPYIPKSVKVNVKDDNRVDD